MRKSFLIFTIGILYITFWGMPTSMDYATSIVPGWHTTVYPPFFILGVFNLGWWFLLFFAYVILEMKYGAVNLTYLIIHLAMSIPLLFLSDLNQLLFNLRPLPETLIYSTALITGIFIMGQLLFLLYFFRTLFSKNNKPPGR